MGELLSLLYDIWSILCGLVDALNSSDHFGLDYVVTMFPSSINDVLTNIDFTHMYEAMIPIGTILAVLYVSLDIMEKATITEFTIDQLILSFVKLVVAVGLINNGILLFQGLNAFSEVITDVALNQALGADLTVGAFTTETVDLPSIGKSVLTLIITMFKLLNPFFVVEATENLLWMILYLVLIPIAAYQRAVRVGIYCLLSPVVLADVAGHGLKNSNAIKFIFSLLGIMMELPVTAIGMYFAFELFGEDGAFTSNVSSASTAGSLACVLLVSTMLFKSKNYIKTLF